MPARQFLPGTGAVLLAALYLFARPALASPQTIPGPTPTVFVPTGPVPLVARHSGKCLDAVGDATRLVPASQNTCTDTPAQRWIFKAVTDGYRIVSAADERLCLNLRGATRAQGARVWLSACSATGQPGEIWMAQAAAAGTMTLVARHSSRCMDVSQESVADGAAILQYTCHGSPNEMWATSTSVTAGVVSSLRTMRPRPIAHVEHDGLNFSIAIDTIDPSTLAVVIPEKFGPSATSVRPDSLRPEVRLQVRMQNGAAIEGVAALAPPFFANAGEVAVRYRFSLGRPAREEDIASITIWIGDRRYTVYPF